MVPDTVKVAVPDVDRDDDTRIVSARAIPAERSASAARSGRNGRVMGAQYLKESTAPLSGPLPETQIGER